MSTLQVSNLHFESTGNNRLQYTNSSGFVMVGGGSNVAVINSSAIYFPLNLNINNFTVNTITVSNTITGTDMTLSGNLIVSGSLTYVNTTTLNIGDNIITLNADLPSNTVPSENAGFEINRGSSANVQLRWNETTDIWQTTADGTNYYSLITSANTSNASVAGIVTVVDSITNTSILTAASANSVKNAYDRAIDANTRAASAQSAAISAYSNATTYASNADNITSGTVGPARLPQANSTTNGAVLILDSVTNTSIAVYAAAANSVKNAYDRAIDANTRASSAQSAAISAYSNAVSVAASDATSKAATAYSNAIAWSGNAALAYSNAIAWSGNAALAYSNAVSVAASDATSKAATAYSNAITFASNATNINTGTLAYARIPANIINTTAAFTISGVHTHSANIILGSSGLSANGSFGTGGQVLHSNGTATYWDADTSGVTQIIASSGLSGGTITDTGTIAVIANNGIISNATGVYVSGGSSLTVNTSGVHVNTTYANTAVRSANNLAGGSAGVIPYQTGSGATSFTSTAGTSGQVLRSSGGATAPTWLTLGALATLDSVDTAQIAAGAVGTTQIAALNVTGGKLADLTVTGGKIADGAITDSKLATAATRTAYASDVSFGVVGTYVFGYTASQGITNGSTIAGSSLEPAGVGHPTTVSSDDAYESVGMYVTKGGAALSGTWLVMGRQNADGGVTDSRATLFFRYV